MNKVTVATGLVFATASLTGLIIFMWKRNSHKKRREYARVGKVKKILFIPVKSMRPLELEEAECSNLGLKYQNFLDRSFMVVRKGNLFTIRQEPRMALLIPTLSPNKLTINGPNMETLEIKIPEQIPENEITNSKVWFDEVKTWDCGDAAAEWLQTYIGKPDLRLVHFLQDMNSRPASKKISKDLDRTEFPIGLQDEASFMLMTQPSIDVLNEKLENKVDHLNFRPNILVEGCKPFEEDKWKCVKLPSGAEFLKLHACSRCLLTTVNPYNGIKSAQGEPLETLKKFRLATDPAGKKTYGISPLFGISLGFVSGGTIKVGDDVYAKEE